MKPAGLFFLFITQNWGYLPTTTKERARKKIKRDKPRANVPCDSTPKHFTDNTRLTTARLRPWRGKKGYPGGRHVPPQALKHGVKTFSVFHSPLNPRKKYYFSRSSSSHTSRHLTLPRFFIFSTREKVGESRGRLSEHKSSE